MWFQVVVSWVSVVVDVVAVVVVAIVFVVIVFVIVVGVCLLLYVDRNGWYSFNCSVRVPSVVDCCCGGVVSVMEVVGLW